MAIPRKVAPLIDVLTRRLANPFGAGSQPIELKDPKMLVRIVNRDVRPQRLHQARQQGYEFVTPEDLADPDQAADFTPSAGRLVRGDREQEVLMKIPKALYEKVLKAKTERNLQRARSRRAALEAAAEVGGAEAVAQAERHLSVKDSIEKVELDDTDLT